jgi:hypothetical protein
VDTLRGELTALIDQWAKRVIGLVTTVEITSNYASAQNLCFLTGKESDSRTMIFLLAEGGGIVSLPQSGSDDLPRHSNVT